ncbi:hypothetical protein EDD17DRAFT_1504601 [Pisolithus thermaeus]|nr:hypothetical protein EV401DRAFT_1896461 [Pisolithus croceorrhizus]KAI6167502.1 hypothetical protein EDD17DRAFT_1504601 [Pisolithus thermaeus]
MAHVLLFLLLTFTLQEATPRWMLTSSSILTFKGPYKMEAVGFGVKLRFVRDCFELAKAVNEEQKEILQTLEADKVLSQGRLVMFEQGSLDYVEHCMLIAMDVLDDEMMNNLLLADGTASTSIKEGGSGPVQNGMYLVRGEGMLGLGENQQFSGPKPRLEWLSCEGGLGTEHVSFKCCERRQCEEFAVPPPSATSLKLEVRTYSSQH